MIRFVLVLALLLNFLSCSSIASAAQITITGYGISYEDAERDALRNAVEQALGTMVEANTLVQNSMLVNDEIYTKSKGFVNNYSVVNRNVSGGTYEETITADVSTDNNSKLMNELSRLGIIERQLRDPKIAVIIPEYHISARIPDPAGETAVIRKLGEAGFSNITDVSNIRYSLNRLAAFSNNDFQMLANSLNVDILVVGEAFSQGVGDVGKFLGNGHQNTGIMSCKARVEAKIYVVRTGQILSANGTYGTAADLTEFIAAKKALNDAGEKMGDYIVSQLIGYGSSSNQSLEVTVVSSDINKINKVTKCLQSINGVNSAVMTNYASGRGSLAVKYAGSPKNLYDQLSKLVEFNLLLKEITYNTLTIGAY